MKENDVKSLVEQIESLEPQKKEIVLRFLDFLLQVQETQPALIEKLEIK